MASEVVVVCSFVEVTTVVARGLRAENFPEWRIRRLIVLSDGGKQKHLVTPIDRPFRRRLEVVSRNGCSSVCFVTRFVVCVFCHRSISFSEMTLIYDLLSNIIKIPERSDYTDTHQISTATDLNLESK